MTLQSVALMFSAYFGTRSEVIDAEEGASFGKPTEMGINKGSCLVGCEEDGTLLLWKCEWINSPDGSRIPKPKAIAVLPLTTLIPAEMFEGEIKGKVMGVVYMENESEPLELVVAVQIGRENLLILTSQLRDYNDSQVYFGNITSACLPLDGINACAEGVWHPHLPLVAKIHSNMSSVLSDKNEGSNTEPKCGCVLVATYSGDPKVPFWIPSAKPVTIHDYASEKVLQVVWMTDWCGAEENPPVLLVILACGKVEAYELTMLAWNANLLSQTVKLGLGLKHPRTLQGTVLGFLRLDSPPGLVADSRSRCNSCESHQLQIVVVDVKVDPTAGLGLILRHSDEKAIVSGFARHPTTGAMLSAEESGVLLVGDHIMAIDEVDLQETSPSNTAKTMAAIRNEGRSYVQVHVRRNMKDDFLMAAAERGEAKVLPSSFSSGHSSSNSHGGGGLLSPSGKYPHQNIETGDNNGLKGLSKMAWKRHITHESDTASMGANSVLPPYRSLVSLPIPWSERCTLLFCFGVGSERKDVCAWEISLDERRSPTTLLLKKLCCYSMPNANAAEIIHAKPVVMGDMSDHSELSASSLVGLCGDGWIRRWSVILVRKGTTSVPFSWKDRGCYPDSNVTYELRSWDLFEVSPAPSSFSKPCSILKVSENSVMVAFKEVSQETDADEQGSTSFKFFRDVELPLENSAASIMHWKGPRSTFAWPNQPWVKLPPQFHLVPEVFRSPSTLNILSVWCNEGRMKAGELISTMDSLKGFDQPLATAILDGNNLEVTESDNAIERLHQVAWKLKFCNTKRQDSAIISSAGALAALLSPVSQQPRIPSSDCTYTDIALSMVPLWLKDETRLLSITELVATAAFRKTRDIFGLTAILYAALGKGNSTLRNLAKAEASSTSSSAQSSSGKSLLSLLSHDLSSSNGRGVASRNGFTLLQKRKYHAAVAVFLLPDPPLLTEAIQTVTVYIKDIQLALLISRLIDIRAEGAPGICTRNCMVGLNTQRLILDDLLPDAYQRRDTYLEAAYLTLLGENRRATLALCRGIAFEGAYEGTFEGHGCVSLDLSTEEGYDDALGLVAWPTLFVALCKRDTEKVTKEEDHGMDLSSFACAALLWWGEAMLANNCDVICLDAVSKAIHHIEDILKSEGQLCSMAEKQLSPPNPSRPHVVNRFEDTSTQQPSKIEEPVDIFAGYDTAPKRQPSKIEEPVDIFAGYDTAPNRQLPVIQPVEPIDIFAAYDVPSQSTSRQQPLARQNENDRECHSSTPKNTQVPAPDVLVEKAMRSYDANELGQWAFQDEKTNAITDLTTSIWSAELLIRALGKLIAKEACLMLNCVEICGRGTVFPASPMDMLSMSKKVHSGTLSELNAYISSMLKTARESIPEISRDAVLSTAILSVKPYICDCVFHKNDVCYERLPAWALLLSLANKGGFSAAVCRASRRLLQMCDMPYSERGPERDALVAGAWKEGCVLEMVVGLHFTSNISLSSQAILGGVLGFRAALILYASQRKEFWVARALIECPLYIPPINELDSAGLEVEVQLEGMPIKEGNGEVPWALSSTSSPSQVELLGNEAGDAYFSPSQLSGTRQAEVSLEGSAPGTCILRDGRRIETREGESRRAFLISFSTVITEGNICHGVIRASLFVKHGKKGEDYREFRCGSVGPFTSMPKLLREMSQLLPFGLAISSDVHVQPNPLPMSNPPQHSWKLSQNKYSPNKMLVEKLSLGGSRLPNPDLTDGSICNMHRSELFDTLELLWLYRVRRTLYDYVAELDDRNGLESAVPLSARICGYRIPFVTHEGVVDPKDLQSAPQHFEESCRNDVLYADVFYSLYLWAVRLDRNFCAKAMSLGGWEDSFVSSLTAIDFEARLIEAGLNYQVIRYVQQDGHHSYFTRGFLRKDLEAFLESDSVRGEERTSLESLEEAGVIRAAYISPERGKGKMHQRGDKEFDADEFFVVIDRWEVEPLHGGSGGGGVLRFGSLGRSIFAPTARGISSDMLKEQCKELEFYAGSDAAMLWEKLGCLEWLAKIPSRFLVQRTHCHTLSSSGGTANASALLSCLVDYSYRNAGLRNLSLRHCSIPLVHVEMLDLKNLAQCHTSRAIDVYAILRLSSSEETQDSRGLTTDIQRKLKCQPPGTLVTGIQRIMPSGHAAIRQWSGAAVFRLALPMPKEDPAVFYPLECNQEEYLLQQTKEGLKVAFDAPPRILHVEVFRRAVMGDHCIGTGTVNLDDLDDSSSVEEWLPLKGDRHHPGEDSAAWFINLRITLRFVVMHFVSPAGKSTSTAKAKNRFEANFCHLPNENPPPSEHEVAKVKTFTQEGIEFM